MFEREERIQVFTWNSQMGNALVNGSVHYEGWESISIGIEVTAYVRDSPENYV